MISCGQKLYNIIDYQENIERDMSLKFAPCHYLNQCWLIISKVQWHSSEHNCTRDTSAPITKISLKITSLKFHLNLPGANELTCAVRSFGCCVSSSLDEAVHIALQHLFGRSALTCTYSIWCNRSITCIKGTTFSDLAGFSSLTTSSISLRKTSISLMPICHPGLQLSRHTFAISRVKMMFSQSV